MSFLDLLFPKKCLECGSSGVYMCLGCTKKVRSGISSYLNISLFKYEGVIRSAIIALKYKYATSIAEELALLVSKKIKKLKIKNNKFTLVPIPLHKKRENQRGFNQVEKIGKIVAKKLNWEYLPDLLIRTKQTTPQVQLKGIQRRQNLSGVFKVNPKHSSLFTDHCSLVIFDDVYTTGSTINEAKKVLHEAGFGSIRSLTIAR